MSDCCDEDVCLKDDEPWECCCFSHNTPGDKDHEKNPAYRGMTHAYTLAHEKELLIWDRKIDGWITKAYAERIK